MTQWNLNVAALIELAATVTCYGFSTGDDQNVFLVAFVVIFIL